MEILILIGLVVGVWFLIKKNSSKNPQSGVSSHKSNPEIRENLSDEQMRDIYSQAEELWESGDSEKIRTAISTFLDLVERKPAFPEPYRKMMHVWSNLNPQENSKFLLETARKAHERFPDDHEFKDDLVLALFNHGKSCWDREAEEEAFEAYLEGLQMWSDSGNPIDDDAPGYVRVGFSGARLFMKNALK